MIRLLLAAAIAMAAAAATVAVAAIATEEDGPYCRRGVEDFCRLRVKPAPRGDFGANSTGGPAAEIVLTAPAEVLVDASEQRTFELARPCSALHRLCSA